MARSLLDAVFCPGDIVELRALPQGDGHGVRQFWGSPQSVVEDHAAEVRRLNLQERCGIYLGVNPRIRSGGGRRADVACWRALFVDFDGVNAGQVQDAVARLEMPEPSILVSSGGGIHAYWLLREPADLALGEEAERELVEAFVPYGADGVCRDAPRVMRLPGTVNTKPGRNGAMATLVCCNPNLKYGIEELSARLPRPEARPGVPSPAPQSVTPDASEQVRRGRACLADVPGAVQGQHGDDYTYRTVCRLRDMGLDALEALAAMDEWNSRCQPPWSAEELGQKVRNAYEYATGEPGGFRRVVRIGDRDVEVRAEPDGKKTRVAVSADGKPVVVDTLNLDSATSRGRLLKSLKGKLDADPAPIEGVLLMRAEELRVAREQTAAGTTPATAGAAPAEQVEVCDEDRALGERMLRNPYLFSEIAVDIQALGIAGEVRNSLVLYVVAASRLLPPMATPSETIHALGAAIMSVSASGKSVLMNTVASLSPPEALVMGTDFTPNALYYFPEDGLRHRLLCVAERRHAAAGQEEEALNATLQFREMLSSGRIDKHVPIKTDAGLETVTVKREGPISYIETTTQVDIDEEDKTRLLVLHVDETPEQTERVHAMQAASAAGSTTSPEAIRRARAKHHAAQRSVKSMRVTIPARLRHCEAPGGACPQPGSPAAERSRQGSVAASLAGGGEEARLHVHQA
jgi:hypothetical protein